MKSNERSTEKNFRFSEQVYWERSKSHGSIWKFGSQIERGIEIMQKLFARREFSRIEGFKTQSQEETINDSRTKKTISRNIFRTLCDTPSRASRKELVFRSGYGRSACCREGHGFYSELLQMGKRWCLYSLRLSSRIVENIWLQVSKQFFPEVKTFRILSNIDNKGIAIYYQYAIIALSRGRASPYNFIGRFVSRSCGYKRLRVGLFSYA